MIVIQIFNKIILFLVTFCFLFLQCSTYSSQWRRVCYTFINRTVYTNFPHFLSPAELSHRLICHGLPSASRFISLMLSFNIIHSSKSRYKQTNKDVTSVLLLEQRVSFTEKQARRMSWNMSEKLKNVVRLVAVCYVYHFSSTIHNILFVEWMNLVKGARQISAKIVCWRSSRMLSRYAKI